MLARILVIALNTYRESVRARLLHGLFALALATTGYSLVGGAYTARNQLRVVSDLGAAAISIYAIVVAVVLAQVPSAGLPLASKVCVHVMPFEVVDCDRRVSS